MLNSGSRYATTTCRLAIVLIVASIASEFAYAQSSDPNSPTPLSANPFSGTIKAQDNTSYYYAFTAGPGVLTISVPVRTNGNLSQISIELSDRANSILASFDATSSGITQERKIPLTGSQRLLLKVTGLNMNDSGSFTVKLKGTVSFNAGAAIEPPARSRPMPGDTTPPRIRIISPQTSRGQGANTGGSRINILGEATDESGVSEVIVRGQPAKLETNGSFSAEVMLKVGENQITVSAADIYGNRAEESFVISRTSEPPAPISRPAGELIKGRYHALLIAAQDYKDRSFQRLDNPLKDAEKLRAVLTTYYTFDNQDVRLLKDPTRDEIIGALEQFEKTLKPEDNLLIFYAGHGQWDEKTRQGYWIPVDVQGESRRKWLSNGEVRDSIRGIAVNHILLITDACFSGGILKGRGGSSAMIPAIEQLTRLPSRTAMTSGAMTTVPDKSVFLEYLIKRLQENEEPYKTATEVFSSLRTAVINNSPVVDKAGNRPSPQYGVMQEAGDEGGDFVFVRRP